MADSITTRDSVIDSRSVTERIEELQGEIQDEIDDVNDAKKTELEDDLKEERELMDGFYAAWLHLKHSGAGTTLGYDEWVEHEADNLLTFDEWIDTVEGENVDDYKAAADALTDFEATEADLDNQDIVAGLVHDFTCTSEIEELASLLGLKSEAEGYCDWRGGESMIALHYFVNYCEELCKDIGAVPQDVPGYIVIDWEATAENIKADYTSVDFDGEEYLVRCS